MSLTNEQLNDPVALTRALVDTESVSGNEERIADMVETALTGREHLRVLRDGNTVFARTEFGHAKRVMLAGHLDTVPLNENFPSHTDDDTMYGCGTSDMKSGTAIALHLAATLNDPVYDLSFVFYECEEVDSERNGLNKASMRRPQLLASDFAILLEPTLGMVEAGCQGTLRAEISLTGKRAHSARSWLGDNAIHSAGAVLSTLENYRARTIDIDGCRYREGLNAVGIRGGVAGNVIPDTCTVTVNFRFAPDRSVDNAVKHVEEVFAGFDVQVTDRSPAAMPGLQDSAAADFLQRVGLEPRAKLGWTDVARFAQLGVPAVNFGPGDPNLAHTKNEHVSCSRIADCCETLRDYLSGGSR